MHLDVNAGLGDAFLGHTALGQRLAPGRSFRGALAHEFERAFCDAYQTHTVMDASRAKTSLGNFKSTPFTQKHVRCGHAHVLELDLAMPVRCIVVSHDGEHAMHGDTRRVRRHQDHRLLFIGFRVRIVLRHEDDDLAARIADPRCPPLAAVKDVFVTVAFDA